MSLRTYVPADIIASFMGTKLHGYAAGTFITATRNTDLWELITGADGEVTRIKSNDRAGLVTVTLQQGSLSNEYLSTQVNLDERLNTAIGPFMVKDFSSLKSIVGGAQAFLKRIPDFARATADESNVEWLFAVPILTVFHGAALTPPTE